MSPPRVTEIRSPLTYMIYHSDGSIARSTVAEGVSHPRHTLTRTRCSSIQKRWVIIHGFSAQRNKRCVYEQPAQSSQRVKEAPAPSNDISDDDERSIGHSPVYLSPTSNASSPHLGGLTTEGSSGHFETNPPVFWQEGDRDVEPDVEGDAQEQLGGPLEPSNDISDDDERSISHPPVYLSPTSSASSPRLGGLTMEDSSGHFETNSPVLRQEGDLSVDLDVENDTWERLGSLLEPPTIIEGRAHVAQAMTAPTLFLQCRVCGAPPTTNTGPTVTMCGHLFCSEYVLRIPAPRKLYSLRIRCITQCVMSTSRCPVCDNALLLYCLFKLDLPVLSQASGSCKTSM